MNELIKQGRALLELGKLEEAEAILREAQSRWPDHPGVLIGFARTAEAQGRWTEALQRWRHVQEVAPDNPWAWIGQGNALLELGELDQAEAVFHGARSRWPDQLAVLTGYARAAMLQQRWAESLDRWRCVLCMRQELPQAWIGQGRALLELGELEEAEAILREAQSRWPDHPGVLMGFARTAEVQGRWSEALQRWRHVQEVAPDNPWAWVGQGNALLELGEFDQAEAVFQGARARWPDQPGVLTGYARAAMLQQRWAEALDRWRCVLCVRQESPQAWIGQGRALLELGKLEEAEAILREAQSRWPDHPGVLMGYARAAEARGRWTEALQRWQLVEAVSPDNEYARMEQANALIELGELDRAEELCLSEQGKWPNNIRPYYLHHLVLERCRRKKEH